MWTTKWILSLSVPIPTFIPQRFQVSTRKHTTRLFPSAMWLAASRTACEIAGRVWFWKTWESFSEKKNMENSVESSGILLIIYSQKNVSNICSFQHFHWNSRRLKRVCRLDHGNESLPGDSKWPFENPSWRSPTTFPNGHKKPSPKGHQQNCQVVKDWNIIVVKDWNLPQFLGWK